MTTWLDDFFRIKEAGSNVRTEIIAGITTFMTMAYIIFVNPGIMEKTGMPFGPVMVATCIASFLGTALMALLANYPLALSVGMGLNAFFTFSVVMGMGISWQTALAAVFVEGIIFILLTLTRVREEIVNSIPKTLKIAISTGIGMFVTFIGLQSGGIIVDNPAVLVGLGDLASPEVILAVLGFFIMVILESYRVKGSILWGILIVTALAIPAGITSLPGSFVSAPPSIGPIFAKMDFSGLASADFWIVVFTFFFVDFFDTVGTLVGVTNRAGMLDREGHLPRARQALMADAIATTAGSVLGTSTITTFVESASGVEQGGRTGLASLVTAFLFLLAVFFSPLVSIVPACATAPALIMVGIFMIISLKDLDFGDWTNIVPAAVTIFSMPFSYSIATGIEFGVITYVIMKGLTGKKDEISKTIYILAVIFILKEIFFR